MDEDQAVDVRAAVSPTELERARTLLPLRNWLVYLRLTL